MRFDDDDVRPVAPRRRLDDNRPVVDAVAMATYPCRWIRLCNWRVFLFRRWWHRVCGHLPQTRSEIYEVRLLLSSNCCLFSVSVFHLFFKIIPRLFPWY